MSFQCRPSGGAALDLVIRAKARDREAFEMLVEIEAPDPGAPPDPYALGLPPDFPLEPAAP